MAYTIDRFKDQIFIIRGTSPVLRYTLVDSNTRGLDLTGATLTWTLKKKLSDPDSEALVQKPMTLTEQTKGKAKVELSTSDTDRVGEFVSEVKMVFSGGTVIKGGQNSFLFGETVYL